MTYIHAELRRKVIERAGNCCEYCRLNQDDNTFSFQIDHVIAEKHDGDTSLENLSLSCPTCNNFKGSDIGSIDRETGKLTPLYNARTQVWDEHFQLQSGFIQPLTPEGRVTVKLLRLNRPEQVEERNLLAQLGRYPCLSL